MPPEAKDVAGLMKELIDWINLSVDEGDLPIPIIAALAHYQFVTIHPYFDGNGRTGRLLTTLVLHMNGYGLKGIFALEEYYAVNLPAYYQALSAGDSHNYYQGRAEADVSEFIDYFCIGMAESFDRIRRKAEEGGRDQGSDRSGLLRMLDPQQRQVLRLFKESHQIASNDVAGLFDMKTRSAQLLCKKWVDSGFLVVADASRKKRLYGLSPDYLELI
ncbi:Fic family protein [Verrucomicrobia bacterium]|nr:Fic family protein [Verrucomicrobiota bacterium]